MSQPLTRQVDRAESDASRAAARYHALDALRAFVILTVVAAHATESFEPGADAWAILDRHTSSLLSVIRSGIAPWPMELMFLTAGFVSRAMVHRRGVAAFARDRLGRIGGTLVLGWLILYPIGVALWLIGAAHSGTLGKFGLPPEFLHLPLWQLWLGVFIKLQFVHNFNLLHLWFLHQLLVIYAAFLGLRALWYRIDPGGARAAWLGRGFTALAARPWCAIALALLTTPILYGMDNAWKNLVVSTPAYSLWPYLPTTLLYGLMFGVGWLLQRHPEPLELLAGRWWGHFAVAIALVLPTRALGEAPDPVLHGVNLALYALMIWCFVLGFIGAFVRFFAAPSARWRYCAEASYWIYLAHWPVVILLQIAVADLDLPWLLKYAFINAVVFPVMFVSYRYLVRDTFIGRQLNGRRIRAGQPAPRAGV